MNKLYLINDIYYVMAFDYYDAITIFQEYSNDYNEDIVKKIESVSSNIICKKVDKEETEDGEEDE